MPRPKHADALSDPEREQLQSIDRSRSLPPPLA